MMNCSLYFDKLWFSVVVSICCKENLFFLSWGIITILICVYNNKYLECEKQRTPHQERRKWKTTSVPLELRMRKENMVHLHKSFTQILKTMTS